MTNTCKLEENYKYTLNSLVAVGQELNLFPIVMHTSLILLSYFGYCFVLSFENSSSPINFGMNTSESTAYKNNRVYNLLLFDQYWRIFSFSRFSAFDLFRLFSKFSKFHAN